MSSVATSRSFLFVPAHRLERCEKAIGTAADMVIIDLEDSVAQQSKAIAREELHRAWNRLPQNKTRVAIRINGADSPEYQEDVLLCQSIRPCAVVVPKAGDPQEIAGLADRLEIPLLPIIESAYGLRMADAIAGSRGVARLVFGNLDFALDLGMEPDRDETELASVRLAIVAASRRAGIASPVDGVTADLENPDQLMRDVLRARRFGFGAKLCIHPSQLNAVRIGFSPSPKEIAEAQELVAASIEARGGAVRHMGKMIDLPVLKKAEMLLQRLRENPGEEDCD